MIFDWDPDKAEANRIKHGVTFDEASSAFLDRLGTAFPDRRHSIGEQRFILLATSDQGRCLTIGYTERGETIRIITARESTRREVQEYESHFTD